MPNEKPLCYYSVLEVSRVLHEHLAESCTTVKSRVTGIHSEQSQAKLHQYMCSEASDLTELTKDRQLTMWLCTKALDWFARRQSSTSSRTSIISSTTVSVEEADVASYIGGFICCKLKQRHSAEDYINVIDLLVSKMEPSHDTLFAAKSKGRLTNITNDGKSLFLSLFSMSMTLKMSAVQLYPLVWTFLV